MLGSICHVVDVVPNDWTAVRGNLSAPRAMLISGEALHSVAWILENGRIIIKFGDEPSDAFAALFQKKRPAYFEINAAGALYNGKLMDQSKRIVNEMIKLEYHGCVEFLRRHRETESCYSCTCELRLPEFGPKADATITITYGSDASDNDAVAPILRACTSPAAQGLKEIRAVGA